MVGPVFMERGVAFACLLSVDHLQAGAFHFGLCLIIFHDTVTVVCLIHLYGWLDYCS